MGIGIEQWRIRIGTFCPSVKKRWNFNGICLNRGTLSLLTRLMFCWSILLVIGGVEQNPGPARGALTRGGFGQSMPNTRARASSQSMLGPNEAGDLGISRRQSFADEGSSTTHLLTAIRADINKNMTDIYSKLTTLTNQCEDISKTCKDLQRENSVLSAQNAELQNKVGALEAKIDAMEGHSRRNNLVFHGIEGRKNEKWDETERKIRGFLCDELEYEYSDTVPIERAHRLKTRRNTDRPPAIVKFASFKDKTTILQLARSKLRGREPEPGAEASEAPNFRISEDYTARVRSIRKSLGAYVVKARNSNKNAALSFDKLIIEDKVYKWDEHTQKPKFVSKNLSFKFNERTRARYQQQHDPVDHVVDDIIGETAGDWEQDLQPGDDDTHSEAGGGDFVDASQ